MARHSRSDTPPAAARSGALCGWEVLVLRPAATRAPLLRVLRRAGATPVALPTLRLLAAEHPDAANAALARALQAPWVLFTSPAAVAFAQRLPAWRPPPAGTAIALGSGTAQALRRAGSHGALQAARADSEGILALPLLQSLRELGLVTAPGGRGLIASTLAARGVQVLRADVYRRLPPRFDARHRALLRALLASAAPRALLHSSSEALHNLLTGLAPEAPQLLPQLLVVAASERLRESARAAGAARVLVSGAPTPQALVATLAAAADAAPGAIR